MSVLNDLKKAIANTPNDSDLGAFIRKYISHHITCCDYPENKVSTTKTHPHNKREFESTTCKQCGKYIF